MPLLFIGLGGFAGAITRYLVDGAVTDRTGGGFPLGHAGANANLHTTRLLRLSEDLPVLIEVVDEEARLRAVLSELDALVGDGLITLERVEVLAYRGTGPAEG